MGGAGGPKKLVESLEIPILISQVMGHGEKGLIGGESL